MVKFPQDGTKRRVLKTLEILGLVVVREHEHISMVKENEDGTRIPLTLPNHGKIKGSTLRRICTQSRITRDEFLAAFEKTK